MRVDFAGGIRARGGAIVQAGGLGASGAIGVKKHTKVARIECIYIRTAWKPLPLTTPIQSPWSRRQHTLLTSRLSL